MSRAEKLGGVVNVNSTPAGPEAVALSPVRGARVLDPVRPDEIETGEPEWLAGALRTFADNVGAKGYPCHFGRRALEQRELFVTHVDRGNYAPLADTLGSFLDYVRPTPRRRQVLAAFVRDDRPPTSHAEYGDAFWEALQSLHEADSRPWPGEFPDKPDDPAWEFSFHGTAMFVFAAAPTHALRRSRNLADCLVLLFQPRNVFLGIEGGTPSGEASRRRIRDRLAEWDEAPSHPSMGDYGDPSNYEWRQYFIAEDDSDVFPTCPFRP
jgi:FPC/CPF motif-containing protein YcgG